jgi:peptidoglycan/LPS O-acetylase OafA/YrhL
MHAHTPSGYRRDIDGLRAIAVLFVIVHHVVPTLMPGGFVGVDVFFVISGYLMTRIIDDAQQARTFRYVDFIWRRCRRIVPALLTVLTATLVAGLCILTGPELLNLGRHLAAASLSGSNILLWREVGYFDTSAALKPLLHLWSLGVEEQFYLVWPFLLALLPMERRVRLLSVVAFVMASLMMSENLAYEDPAQAFYLLHSRGWELGVGAALALGMPLLPSAADTARGAARRIRDFASLFGVTLIAYSAFATTEGAAWPGISALAPVVGAALVVAAGSDALLNRTVLSASPSRWIGQRSYALYLWHWPPLAFLNIIALERAWSPDVVLWSGVLLMLPALALSHLTLRFVEQPARSRAEHLASAGPIRLRHLRGYLLPLGALAAVGALVVETRGLPARYGTSGADAVATLREASPDSITTYSAHATRCRLADKGNATWCWRIPGTGSGIAVFGDSHAEVLFAGLAAMRTGEPLFLTGRKGCAPILQSRAIEERTAEICRRASNLAHEAIRTDSTLSTVLVVARGPAYMSGVGFGVDSQRRVVPVSVGDSMALRHAYEQGLDRSLRTLLDVGKRVILVLDTPELGFLPEECLIGRPLGLRDLRTPCAVPRAVVENRNREYRRLIARLQMRLPQLEVFDAAPSLCDDRFCHARRGERLLYSDANHLTLLGSQIVTERLRTVLVSQRRDRALLSAR